MKKIARICWSSNGWKTPSGRLGKSSNKDSYEYQNGYGHEEWLLDTTKLVDGYHYGYIQAIGKHRDKYLDQVFDVSLYSINSDTKQRWWLGEIKNLEVVSAEESKRVYKKYKKNGWYKEMVAQLNLVGANIEEFKKFVTADIFSVVRYKPEDLNLLEEPQEFSADDPAVTSNYYNLKNKKLEPNLERQNGFQFIAGHREGKSKTKRAYSDYTKEVSLLHNQLQTALYEELSQLYGYASVATELGCGSGNRIDLVVKKEKSYSLYEIKTSNSAKSCIREALGQLMEYAFYNDNIDIDKLVIVSPHELKSADTEYLERIKSKFSLPMEYMSYSL
ncbi:hypothetical protein L3V77_21070 [Vibrio sp. DW001]|uniref:hypothetical protein n=1 Tax=Vibrio sp. DW001 TaxID=2912315 RepID=UPI0023AF7511|nr:hypothetical protein [Vibrio sp. DW001]WED29901.1 hypothetical protein L3V77_21070 [Vibrio sp. DW001]